MLHQVALRASLVHFLLWARKGDVLVDAVNARLTADCAESIDLGVLRPSKVSSTGSDHANVAQKDTAWRSRNFQTLPVFGDNGWSVGNVDVPFLIRPSEINW
jgi:hypothetical protein